MAFTAGLVTYKRGSTKVSLNFDKTTENSDIRIVTAFSDEGSCRATVTLIPKAKIQLVSCSLFTDVKVSGQNFFLNGYQTWTDSREFTLDETIKNLSPVLRPIMSMYGDYSFFKYSRGKLRSHTYTYIRLSDDEINLLGSLSEKSGYTVFEYSKASGSLTVKKDCEGLGLSANSQYKVFDLISLCGSEAEVFDEYFKAAGIDKPKAEPCIGWTSWYYYYTAVREADILENLNAFYDKMLPIDIFQIDDGYQNAVGDWLLINDKFPNGMDSLAAKIHEKGYKAGLWLAPIICEKRSELYRKHPDWVSCRAGINPGWSGIFYALDFYNEGVRDYLRKVFDTVLNIWNYDMVKLDFLYAACLPKRHDKTRGQVMCEFMEFLREISGNKIILGCGAVLGSSFGLVDYCRVSSDVALKWEDDMLKRLHYRERVSTINALTSTIGRHHLSGRAFYNDPDVFILRDGNNKLTPNQRYTLFIVNAVLGGLVFTSDNVKNYTARQLELFKSLYELKNAQVKKVTQGELLTVDFECSDRKSLLISNLNGTDKETVCPCDGTVSLDNRLVLTGDKLMLRPFESICINKK